ncbi:MAG: L-rhamnose isomerase [Acholeplasmataceae bacterium]|nr:L-rhamnose isomerase [Acholeplasmataceae bacterium]
MNDYTVALKKYEHYEIDVEKAINLVKDIPVSIHCWQGDDISGLLSHEALTGGIQVTGNYPGKASTFEELKQDFLKAIENIPGTKRINLHAIYAVSDTFVDRNEIEPKHFDPWIDFALENNIKIDFNPTFFSHEKVIDNFTLSSPIENVREFWIEHGKRSRKIAAYIGKRQKSPCLCNIWIPDGMKDIPGDRLSPRKRLKDSLDQIYSDKYDENFIIDSVESKVFGIGLESYTVGSSEFYINYAAHHGINALLDSGHYHPTENVADKISSLLLFNKFIALHITRPVRWDSDHVVSFNDDVREIAREIIASNQIDKFLIGLDFFDATINRVAAWITGSRNVQKALLHAALYPHKTMKKFQDEADFTSLLVLNEEIKTLPFGTVWDKYCEINSVPKDGEWLEEIKHYERDVQLKR